MFKLFIKNSLKKLGLSVYVDFLLFKIRGTNNQISDEVVLNFYNKIIKKGDLVFDIGANIGNYTAIFSSLGAKVICLEPQNYCYSFLKLRFGYKKNIIIIQKAVDANIGKKEIFVSEHHGISSMSREWIENVQISGRFSNTHWNKKEKVKTTTLSELINIFGTPNYCKIDVEGYEFNVIQGLENKIPLISFELSYENITLAFNCINYLNSLGEIQLNLILGNYKGFVFDEWMDKDSFIKYLQELKEKLFVADIFVKFIS